MYRDPQHKQSWWKNREIVRDYGDVVVRVHRSMRQQVQYVASICADIADRWFYRATWLQRGITAVVIGGVIVGLGVELSDSYATIADLSATECYGDWINPEFATGLGDGKGAVSDVASSTITCIEFEQPDISLGTPEWMVVELAYRIVEPQKLQQPELDETENESDEAAEQSEDEDADDEVIEDELVEFIDEIVVDEVATTTEGVATSSDDELVPTPAEIIATSSEEEVVEEEFELARSTSTEETEADSDEESMPEEELEEMVVEEEVEEVVEPETDEEIAVEEPVAWFRDLFTPLIAFAEDDQPVVLAHVEYSLDGAMWQELGVIFKSDTDSISFSLPILTEDQLNNISLRLIRTDAAHEYKVFLDSILLSVEYAEVVNTALETIAPEQSRSIIRVKQGRDMHPIKHFEKEERAEFVFVLPQVPQQARPSPVHQHTHQAAPVVTEVYEEPEETNEIEIVEEIIEEVEIVDDTQVDVSESTTSPDTNVSLLQSIFGPIPQAHAQSALEMKIVSKQLVDPSGTSHDDLVFVTGNRNTLDVSVDQPDSSFMPGAYLLSLEVEYGSIIYELEQEFYWGVLVINSDKAIYQKGDTAYVQMAALTAGGDARCDANLTLEVTSPAGIRTFYDTADESLQLSGICNGNNVTDTPDYFVYVDMNKIGSYTFELIDNETGYTTQTGREVVAATPVTLTREGATRINPFKSVYTMTLTISSETAFTGSLTEYIPEDFDVIFAGNGDVDGQSITWDVDIPAGKEVIKKYTYQAPKVSPYIYELGPAELRARNSILSQVLGKANTNITEAHAWELASDAGENFIAFWDGATIPSGWTCLSCGGGENQFADKMIRGAASYDAVGGGTSFLDHTPTLVSIANSADPGNNARNGGSTINVASGVHSHALAFANVVALDPYPLYRTLKVIRYDTEGDPASLPTGIIVPFDASVPTGWTRYSSQDGYYIYASSTAGATGGSNTHSHGFLYTLGTPDTTTNQRTGSGLNAGRNNHSGTDGGDAATDTQSNEPPHIDVVLGKLNATSSPVNGMIAMWDAAPPTGWDSVSGSGQPFNGQFIHGAATYNGTSAGSTSHSHANVVDTSGTGATTVISSGTNGSAADPNHTHVVTFSISTDSHVPPYIDVVFAKRNVPDYPIASAVSIESGAASVTLTEGTTTSIDCVGTVTDSDGFADIATTTAYLMKTGTASSTADSNDTKYTLSGDSECVPSGGSGNSETYTCSFDVQFYAEAGSWTCEMWPEDGGQLGSSASDTITINELLALSVSNAIDYGTLSGGQDTGSTNATTTITNTGNVEIYSEIGGDNMVSGANSISYAQQKYSLSGFTYSSGGTVLAPSSTPDEVQLNLPKPTAATSTVTDEVYWGIAIPGLQPSGAYTGQNYFIAVSSFLPIRYLFAGTNVNFSILESGASSSIAAATVGGLSKSSRVLVRTSTGDLYASIPGSSVCEIWKSTNDGDSWTEQDTSNSPTCETTLHSPSIAIDSNDDIHMIYRNGGDIRYLLFDTGTDTFGTSELAANEPNDIPDYALTIDSNDIPHIAYMDDLASISAQVNVKYKNRVSGSWSSFTVQTYNSEFVYLLGSISITMNEDNIPEIAHVYSSALRAHVADQNNPSSFTSHTVDSGVGVSIPSIVVDGNGDTWIAYVDENGASDYVTLAHHPDASAWTSGWTTTNNTNTVGGSKLSAAVAGSTIYVMYEDDNDDVVYDTYNGSSWGGEVVEQAGLYLAPLLHWQYYNTNY